MQLHGDLALQIALIGYKRRNELRDYSMGILLWNAPDIGSLDHILGYVLFASIQLFCFCVRDGLQCVIKIIPELIFLCRVIERRHANDAIFTIFC